MLALAVGCEVKWLYNSSRRINRPIARSMGEATWWRLVHHLAVGLGAPLVDAAGAADALLVSGMHPGRVRLRATRDESVAVVVDLARFHDGAALAMAAAQFLAVPRARGRPRSKPSDADASMQFTTDEMASVLHVRSLGPTERLERSLDSVPPANTSITDARQIVRSLADAKTPFVVVGGVAESFHCAPWSPASLDLCVDLSPRYGTSVSRVLNGLAAEPRGAPARDGFHLDAALLRAPPMLALHIGTLDLNVYAVVTDVGEYQQVETRSTITELEGRPVRVSTLESIVQSGAAGRRDMDRERVRRQILLRALREIDSGTR